MSTLNVNEIHASSMNNFEINFDDGESMIVNGSCNLHPLSHFKLPGGTTAQRPSSPAVGMIRFNTEELQVEVYNGSSWLQIIRASAGGNNGSTPALAAANVQELMDSGVAADGNYYMNIDGTTRRYFVPINSHPYYILIGNWGGGGAAFFSNAEAAFDAPLAAREVRPNGVTIPPTSPIVVATGESSRCRRSSSFESPPFAFGSITSDRPNVKDLASPSPAEVQGDSSISWRILALSTTSFGA